jgi:S1-C subfamily serine protease
MAKQAMDQLIKYGEVRRGRLGIGIQSLTPDLSEALGLDVKEGAVVNAVEPGSPAERAGLKSGDVVVDYRGEPIKSAQDLRNRVGLTGLGTEVPITVVRDGKRRQLTAKIEAAPADGESASAGQPGDGGATAPSVDALQGAQFRDVPRDDPRYSSAKGAIVARIEPGSSASRSGLREGDVITAVNRTPVASAADLLKALRQQTGRIALNVQRGDAQMYLLIR